MNNNKYILISWYSDGSGKPKQEFFSDPIFLAQACHDAGSESKCIIVDVVAPNGDVVAIYNSTERNGKAAQ